ncbi:MAG: peptide deformylase [Nitrospinae bacterium]|nr:peptide deformylase [Nitrospinota bacterium]
MSILTIRNCLDPILRQKCDPIENIDGNLVALSQDMIETMFNAPGAGLAANQVGIAQRIIVVDLGIGTDKINPVAIVNPEIAAFEEEMTGEEGCLSIPDLFAEVKRARLVELKGYDLDGNAVRYEAEDCLARAFQHELDHLNGILFWDKLGKIKRDLLKRKFKKKLKEKSP